MSLIERLREWSKEPATKEVYVWSGIAMVLFWLVIFIAS